MGASLRSQSSLEMLPASLGLLRPASATGGGLRAPLFAKREAIDGAIPEDGVRPLAEESPRPASALPSEGAREAPREDGQSLLLYKSSKTEAASRGAGQLIAKVVQWKGNGLTDNPKSFALATESVNQPPIVQRSICAGRVPSGTLESANR